MPSPTSAAPTRGHKKKARTRRQLLGAATRVLATKGESMTASDVTAEAGVSNGTFYNYFTDREDLLDALAEHSVATLVDDLAETVVDPDPARRFASTTAHVLARAAGDPTWALAALRLADRPRSLDVEVSRHLRADLAEGHATGRFSLPPDDTGVDLVLGLVIMSIRRIVRGEARVGHVEAVLVRALGALGVAEDEREGLASQAAAESADTVGAAG